MRLIKQSLLLVLNRLACWCRALVETSPKAWGWYGPYQHRGRRKPDEERSQELRTLFASQDKTKAKIYPQEPLGYAVELVGTNCLGISAKRKGRP
jgi:hypothetical protein